MDNLKEKFVEYTTKRDISMTKASAGIGYSVGVISQVLSGTYKADATHVWEKIAAWLDIQISRELQTKDLPTLALPRTTQIKSAVRITHEEKFIALILGHSGSGKSRGLEAYHQENPHTSILIKCDPVHQLSAIITLLAQALGLESRGRISEVSDRIIAELLRRDVVVIFDEADYLTDQCLEYLRIAINDKGRSGLVFAGLERIQGRIKNLRTDHRQLENRIGMLLRVPEVEESDVKTILDTVWPDQNEGVVKLFWEACRRSLHILTRHISLTRRQMIANNLNTPSAQAVAGAAKYLLQ